MSVGAKAMPVFPSLDEDVVAGIRQAVGHHNYFRVNVYDAVDMVTSALGRAGLDGGWQAAFLTSEHEAAPEGAIRVGQVRVHSGDPYFPLIIRRIRKEVSDG